MKARIKKIWLAALRSGKYKQSKGTLKHNNGGYCCLGVLTELYRSEHKTKFRSACKESNGGFQSAYLPEKVMKWSGITKDNPVVDGVTLSVHNDGRYGKEDSAKDFNQIADLIEMHL